MNPTSNKPSGRLRENASELAADPGLWFELLWGAHWIGTIIACLVVAWLTFGSVAPRWAVAVLIAFTIVTTVLVAAPPAYTGLGVYAGAVLWRQRKQARRNPPVPESETPGHTRSTHQR